MQLVKLGLVISIMVSKINLRNSFFCRKEYNKNAVQSVQILEEQEEKNMKYYVCKHCGNIIEFAENKGVPVMCCGEKMTELVPGTSDGAVEKHVPAVVKNGNKVLVEVGSVEHPMVEAHYIEWIVIETRFGSQKRKLSYTDAPKAEFLLCEGDEFVAAYAYCNLHGLWKSE